MLFVRSPSAPDSPPPHRRAASRALFAGMLLEESPAGTAQIPSMAQTAETDAVSGTLRASMAMAPTVAQRGAPPSPLLLFPLHFLLRFPLRDPLRDPLRFPLCFPLRFPLTRSPTLPPTLPATLPPTRLPTRPPPSPRPGRWGALARAAARLPCAPTARRGCAHPEARTGDVSS
jgi:hypothetical protein